MQCSTGRRLHQTDIDYANVHMKTVTIAGLVTRLEQQPLAIRKSQPQDGSSCTHSAVVICAHATHGLIHLGSTVCINLGKIISM